MGLWTPSSGQELMGLETGITDQLESQIVNFRNIRGRDRELWMIWWGGLVDSRVPGLYALAWKVGLSMEQEASRVWREREDMLTVKCL